MCIPFPTFTLLPTVTATAHCRNELPLTTTVEPLTFPTNNTATQPPPATALLDVPNCGESFGTNACTLFSIIVDPVILTFNISKAAIAPPHVEHGCAASAGQPLKPPFAELRAKVLLSTLRNRPAPGPVADIAPPLAALQLMKLHCDTTTLLPLADTAPPLEVGFEQLWKVTPVMVTFEFTILRAAPVVARRRLQSKTVADGTPLMTSDGTLLMSTVDSLNAPALRYTYDAPMI